MTQILIDASDFMGANWIKILVVIAAIIIIFMLWKRSNAGASKWAQMKLKMPVVGKISAASNSAIFANTMSLLLSCGLPMTQTVEVTSKVMPNYAMATATNLMVQRLEEGRRLADCMRDIPSMPSTLVDMAAVGEETGSVEETLSVMGTFYDNETNRLTQNAVSKLEPAVLVFIALFAGYIVVALYIAMFSMYSAM